MARFDPHAEERRRWLWRGALAAATVIVTAGHAVSVLILRWNGALRDQERQRRPDRAAGQWSRRGGAPVDPLDLNLALDALTEVAMPRPRARGPLTAL